MLGGGLPVMRSLLVLIRQLVIGPVMVVGPGASAQVSLCVKADLVITIRSGINDTGDPYYKMHTKQINSHYCNRTNKI